MFEIFILIGLFIAIVLTTMVMGKYALLWFSLPIMIFAIAIFLFIAGGWSSVIAIVFFAYAIMATIFVTVGVVVGMFLRNKYMKSVKMPKNDWVEFS